MLYNGGEIVSGPLVFHRKIMAFEYVLCLTLTQDKRFELLYSLGDPGEGPYFRCDLYKIEDVFSWIDWEKSWISEEMFAALEKYVLLEAL